MRAALALTLLVTIVPSSAVSNQCPFQTKEKKDFLMHLNGGPMNNENSQRLDDYLEALDKIDFGEVRQAIKKMLTDSQNFWPADYGTYAGLFIRLAWHSAGSCERSCHALAVCLRSSNHVCLMMIPLPYLFRPDL
jgi:hypothetical protein